MVLNRTPQVQINLKDKILPKFVPHMHTISHTISLIYIQADIGKLDSLTSHRCVRWPRLVVLGFRKLYCIQSGGKAQMLSRWLVGKAVYIASIYDSITAWLGPTIASRYELLDEARYKSSWLMRSHSAEYISRSPQTLVICFLGCVGQWLYRKDPSVL